MNLSKYNKFLVALAGGAVVVAIRHFGVGNLFVQDFITLATALGVYQVPNAK